MCWEREIHREREEIEREKEGRKEGRKEVRKEGSKGGDCVVYVSVRDGLLQKLFMDQRY